MLIAHLQTNYAILFLHFQYYFVLTNHQGQDYLNEFHWIKDGDLRNALIYGNNTSTAAMAKNFLNVSQVTN